ncbi:hypothetical protein D3C83_175160 [compost metagenome]
MPVTSAFFVFFTWRLPPSPISWRTASTMFSEEHAAWPAEICPPPVLSGRSPWYDRS